MLWSPEGAALGGMGQNRLITPPPPPTFSYKRCMSILGKDPEGFFVTSGPWMMLGPGMTRGSPAGPVTCWLADPSTASSLLEQWDRFVGFHSPHRTVLGSIKEDNESDRLCKVQSCSSEARRPCSCFSLSSHPLGLSPPQHLCDKGFEIMFMKWWFFCRI